MTFFQKINGFLFFLIVAGVGILISLYAFDSSNDVRINTGDIPVLTPQEHHTEHGDSILTSGHLHNIDSEVMEIDEDIWITGINLILTNAPQATLHHIFLFDLNERDALCPKRPALLMAMGAESESEIRLREPYGVLIPRGAKLQVVAMFHNPSPPIGSGETYENVHAGFKLIHAENKAAALKPVTFYLPMLSDEPHCTTNTFAVPAHSERFIRSSDITSAESPSYFRFPRSGMIIGMGPHFHPWEGGKKVEAFLNGKPLASFTPELVSRSPSQWLAPPVVVEVPVKKGDLLTLTAEYENHHEVPITGAMGMVGFFVAYDSLVDD